MGPDNAPGMARLAGERSQNASEMAERLVIEIEEGAAVTRPATRPCAGLRRGRPQLMVDKSPLCFS